MSRFSFLLKNPKFYGWNAMYQFTGGINFAMSMHSMLYSAGVHNQAVSFTASILGKDMIGQVSTVAYTHKNRGCMSDRDPLRYGMVMTSLNQVCFCIENLTVFFPQYFLLIAGIGNIGKNIGMIGTGSVGFKAIEMLSNGSSRSGELYAKVSSHNSLFSSLGMGMGIYLISQFPDHAYRVIMICPIFYGINILCYYKSLRSIFDIKKP